MSNIIIDLTNFFSNLKNNDKNFNDIDNLSQILAEIIKIAALKKNDCRVVPHSPYFGPGFMATLQVIGALTPESEIERLYVDLKADLYDGVSNIDKDGRIFIPNGPGLGAEPDLDIIEKYLF